MSDLIEILTVSVERKPKLGEPCNHCGYCCLTEICDVGKAHTGKEFGPCELLQYNPDNEQHLCGLLKDKHDTYASMLGAGKGCCAETQDETLARLMGP